MRRKWLTRRIRYPIAARFLRIGRILRVNPPGRAAGGADGTGVTRAGTAAVAGAGSQPDRRLDGQVAGLVHAFPFGSRPFPAGSAPRSGPRPAESPHRPHQSRDEDARIAVGQNPAITGVTAHDNAISWEDARNAGKMSLRRWM